MLSGTAVKAIISYVSDYISKLGLKSYQAFASVFDVFEKNVNVQPSIGIHTEITRKVLVQMINSMSTKMEIGSPMASMYLLGNQDHYTSHAYVNFSWRTYVNFVQNYWIGQVNDENIKVDEIEEDSIALHNNHGEVVGSSIIDDYCKRPTIYERVNLYEWIQTHQKTELNNKEKLEFIEERNQHLLLNTQTRLDKENKFIKHAFQDDHNEVDSFGVFCDFSRLHNIIPNFMGGALPRSDRGDREYYCMSI
ncbi:hypothetical protein B0H19DRAFT_927520, partial [Mycena capillaripes]